jgi:hypothetical protein
LFIPEETKNLSIFVYHNDFEMELGEVKTKVRHAQFGKDENMGMEFFRKPEIQDI